MRSADQRPSSSTARKPSKRLAFALTIIAATIIAAATLLLSQAPASTTLHGSLFVSDAGESHGGFEYNAEWNATLTAQDTAGTLKLALRIGLGDALEKHEYHITDVTIEPTKVSMKIEGRPLVLIWVEKDTVWDHAYDKHYIASWGGYAPPEEIRGTISPKTFPGLVDHFYVELRLRPPP